MWWLFYIKAIYLFIFATYKSSNDLDIENILIVQVNFKVKKPKLRATIGLWKNLQYNLFVSFCQC